MATELRTQRCRDLLEKLPEPKTLWKWMLWCTEIPRPSGSTQLLRDELKKVAAEWHLEYSVDAVNNIKIVKKATEGYEDAPTVCLQAHQDIVFAWDKSIRPEYNPETDPVWPALKNGWLVAEGTSLGADDGIGIATAMTILQSNTIPHPKIEFLCTDDEEVGTTGAQGLDPSFLCPKTKYFINLDSEDKNALCLGCAGGGDVVIEMPITREAIHGAVPVLVRISGLKGAHSSDIQLYRANAFKLVTRMLLVAWGTGFVFSNLTGGSAFNAIPTDAAATVLVPASRLTDFKNLIQDEAKIIETEYKVEEPAGIHLEINELTEPVPMPVSRQSTRDILNLWKLVPCNPFRMCPDMPDTVESSMATTLVTEFSPAKFTVRGLARTCRSSQWTEIEQLCQAIADFSRSTLTISGKFPEWLPKRDAPLARLAESSHQDLFTKPCRVYATHGGLECGIMLQKLPHCQAISIGPQVTDPHTIHEACEVASGDELLQWAAAILKAIDHELQPPAVEGTPITCTTSSS